MEYNHWFEWVCYGELFVEVVIVEWMPPLDLKLAVMVSERGDMSVVRSSKILLVRAS